MDKLAHFTIPYAGLKVGRHELNFEIDDQFFELMEGSPIKKGNFRVILDLDKRHDMGIMIFHITGQTPAVCERCNLDFDLDLESDFRLVLKFGENTDIADDEVMYLPSEKDELNVAQYLYESIVLSMPLIIVHEDTNDCDPDVIKVLQSEQTEDEPITKSSIWDQLKNLDLNN